MPYCSNEERIQRKLCAQYRKRRAMSVDVALALAFLECVCLTYPDDHDDVQTGAVDGWARFL